MLNLRGELIAVFDMGDPWQLHPSQLIVVVDTEAGPAGLIVEDVQDVVSVPASDVAERPVGGGRRVEVALVGERLLDVGNPAEEVAHWLDVDDLEVSVAPWLRPLVRFEVMNLVDGAYPEGVDLVFCRNVLLYFCPDAAQRVLARLARCVRDDGILFLGYMDPEPAPHTGWRPARLDGVRYFRRVSSRPPRGRPEEGGRTSWHRQPSEGTPSAPSVEAGRTAALSFARGLASQRDFEGALALLEAMTGEAPLEVAPQVLLAVVADEAGLVDVALSAARRACFLAPREPFPLSLLGACLKRAGAAALAVARFREALALLARQPSHAPVPYSDGLTAS